MGQVLAFKPHLKPWTSRPEADPARYFCQQCNSEQFRLLACGTIRCSACGVRMSNIRVRQVRPEVEG